MFSRLLTKNLKEIPLLWINFNLQHYRKLGKINSCMLHIHPTLRDDKYIIETLNGLVDYIRDNYNMEDII